MDREMKRMYTDLDEIIFSDEYAVEWEEDMVPDLSNLNLSKGQKFVNIFVFTFSAGLFYYVFYI